MSLSVERGGKFWESWGESGCGKSTLSKTIAGLNRDYSGTIETDGDLRLQMVFQDPFSSLIRPRKLDGF